MHYPTPDHPERALNSLSTIACDTLIDTIFGLIITINLHTPILQEFKHALEYNIIIPQKETYLSLHSKKGLTASWHKARVARLLTIAEYTHKDILITSFTLTGTGQPVEYKDQYLHLLAMQETGENIQYNDQEKIAEKASDYAIYLRKTYTPIAKNRNAKFRGSIQTQRLVDRIPGTTRTDVDYTTFDTRIKSQTL